MGVAILFSVAKSDDVLHRQVRVKLEDGDLETILQLISLKTTVAAVSISALDDLKLIVNFI